MFSLDGVHPSNTGHALVANAFIAVINQAYGQSLAAYSQSELDAIGAEDPFLDLDGDGVVHGRPLKGRFETLGPFFGVSGDAEGLRAARVAGRQSMFKHMVSWGPKRSLGV